MKAIILVGGLGTRLRPLTYSIPKQMLPIVEVPMIERKIAHLSSFGINDIVLSMGYKPDVFRNAYPDNVCAGAKLTYVIEPEPLGTAGAIAYSARQVGVDSTFLAMNGDTLIDLDFNQVISFHKSHQAEATIALTPVEDPSRFGVVPTNEQGRVTAFIEKPARHEAPTNLINGGTYVLEPSVIERIKPNQEVSIEREIFPQIVSDGLLFAGVFGDYWLDIGTPESYLQANTDLLDTVYKGNSFIGKGAAIASDAVLKRSVVGAGAQVQSGATLVDAVLLPGAVVGTKAVIDRSIVGENSNIGDGSKLINLSVIGSNQDVEPGTFLDGEKI